MPTLTGVRLYGSKDTDANWKKNNPTLTAGEIIIVTDSKYKMKVATTSAKYSEIGFPVAEKATQLETARKIGNASFNGTADITLAQIGAAASSHSHTKSQITDFPTTLKNPSSIAIKLNGGSTEGTNLFTYDGSAAKTVNITPSGIGAATSGHNHDSAYAAKSHTHNYAGSSSAGGAATSANKLATARTLSLKGLSDATFTFDGSGNISADNWGYGTAKYVTENTVDKPYFRIATTSISGSYTDASMILMIDGGNTSSGFGILKVCARSDNIATAGKSYVELIWLVRQGFGLGQFFVKGYAPANAVQYADLYFKASGTYNGVVVTALSMGARGSKSRSWTFDSGDPRAAADIRTYSYTTTSSDAGVVSYNKLADKPSSFTPSSHTHTKSQITDFPTSLQNPNNIVIKLNNGGTEGTNLFTYNGSSAKTVNITPSGIGAAASSHTHTKSQITDFPSSMPASDVYSWAKASSKPSYSWSEINSKPSTFTPSSHNHSSITRADHLDTVDKLNAFIEANTFKYATIAELDGLNGLTKNDGIILSASWKDSTKYGHQIYLDDSGYTIAHRYNNNGSWSAWKTLIDSNNYTSYTVTKTGSGASGTWGISISGNAVTATTASTANSVAWGNVSGKPSSFTPSSHTHTKSQITDFPTSLQNPNSITIKLNGGSTEGTNLFTYNGSSAKSLNITASSIGAATSGHSHSGYASSSHTHSQYYDANASRTANTVLAAPNGSAGGATFRKLVAADIPSHSHSDKMGSVTANGYQGLARSDGNTSDWIRTTSNGIIPYQSGGSGNGHCGIGTSSWYFSTAYIDTVYGNLQGCVDGVSKTLARNGNVSYPMTFNWSGQGGQPTWLWGGENGTDMYVYNPSNFTVYSAKTLTIKGTNTIKNDSTGYDTSTNWAVQNNSIHWYNSALLKNQPSTYGFLFNITIGNGGEAHQMWFTQPGGSIFHRGGNSSDWANSSTWDQIVDTRNSASAIGVEYFSSTHVIRFNNNSVYMDIGSSGYPGIFATSGGTGISLLSGTDWHAVCANQYLITALGTSSNRWSNVYISGSVQSSSDEYLKDIIPTGIDERYEKFFMLLNPILYKWKNNDERLERLHDRIHCGLGARETEQHAIECGLDSMSVAAICKDKLEKPTEDGRTDEYGIAYSELHGLEIHMIQKAHKKIEDNEKEIENLKQENENLKSELQELKELVQQLLNK